MEITVETIGLRELIADTRRASQALRDTPFVGRITADARQTMAQRTLSGKDVNNADFKDYSDEQIYISRTHRPRPHGGQKTTGKSSVFYPDGYAGYRRATVGHDRVDLFATGNMFRSWQAKQLTSFKGVVTFNKTREALKALQLNKKREFIGLNSGEVNVLQERFGKMIAATLRKYGL